MPDRVTMSDVAREAQVSSMTVSRVINNKDEISPATRQRVLDVIDRLGYRPSGIARGLVTQRTGTLGLVVPDIANPFFSDLARGAEDWAYAEGYNVFLCNTDENTQRERSVLETLEEKRVDGLVLCSSRLDDAELRVALAAHSAGVLVNRPLEGSGVGTVLVDDAAGARTATRLLLEAGHRRVGLLAGPPASYSGSQRLMGYCAALDAAGIAHNPAWIRHCSSEVEGGRRTSLELLVEGSRPTALLCYNDLVAIGALQACAELGCRVPDDLAIVGSDDIALAALVTPTLTTSRVPRRELGAQAMRMLLDRINGCAEGREVMTLQPELIVRASAP